MARKPAAKPKMKIRWVRIETLVMNPQNPNLHIDGIDEIARSIKMFGWQQPIVVTEANVILVGEGRYRAATQLKEDLVPVTTFHGSLNEQKALMMADNKSGEFSKRDENVLASLVEGMDVDLLEATGFTDRELERFLDNGDAKPGTRKAGSAESNLLTELTYRVIVNCTGEKHQSEIIELLEEAGLGDVIEPQVL